MGNKYCKTFIMRKNKLPKTGAKHINATQKSPSYVTPRPAVRPKYINICIYIYIYIYLYYISYCNFIM